MININIGANGRAICAIAFKPREGLQMRFINFKIDTGADFSTISKKNLYHLGYDAEWIKANATTDETQIITVASGEQVQNYYIKLPLLNFYGYEALNWPFAILLDEKDADDNIVSRDYRPLLGLDLLGGFNFTLDNDNDCFILARTKTFKRRRPFFHNQEIHEIHNI